MNSQESI